MLLTFSLLLQFSLLVICYIVCTHLLDRVVVKEGAIAEEHTRLVFFLALDHLNYSPEIMLKDKISYHL